MSVIRSQMLVFFVAVIPIAVFAAEEQQRFSFAEPGQGYEHLEPVSPYRPSGQGFFFGTPMRDEASEELVSIPEPEPYEETIPERLADPNPIPKSLSPMTSDHHEQMDTTPEPPMPGSAAWIRDNIEIYKERALDNPDDLDAVRAYALLDRMMNERSLRFADSFRTVQHTDPWLQLDYGSAGTRPNARLLRTREERREMRDIWADASDRVGLIIFVKNECIYCDVFVGTLDRAAQNRGLNVLAVNVNGDPVEYPFFEEFYSQEMIDEFGVTTVPSVYLYDRETGEHRLVSVGAYAETEFKRRLTIHAYDMGALSTEQFNRTQYTLRNNGNTIDDKLRDVLVELRNSGESRSDSPTGFIDPQTVIRAVQEAQRSSQ